MTNLHGYNILLNKKILYLLENYDEEACGPKYENIFWSISVTPLNKVRVVILGQDPYPTKNVANGLAFSVSKGSKLPPSLKNIFKELYEDLNVVRTNGDLIDWSRQGILLLNSVLTVEFGKPNSHKNLGWEEVTDSIIKQISSRGNCVFVLLGNHAQQKEKLINTKKNKILKTSHPSPLSSYRGFSGSKIFSQINNSIYFGEKIIF